MIGAIADDFTGATDIAVAFRRAGLRVVIFFTVPEEDSEILDHDVAIVALKTRTIPASEAVRRSLQAAQWLRRSGAAQIFFKYCSTFDSQPEGNIGPVADALMTELGTSHAVVVPSSPEHLRTQYMGHLFVDDVLLSDSSMRHHPLTPMTNSYIPEVLAQQTARPVALLEHRSVASGYRQFVGKLEETISTGAQYLVVDALNDRDLKTIGEAVVDDVLITGAAGLAGGVGRALADRKGSSSHSFETGTQGPLATVTLAGSCSSRTLEQVNILRANAPSLRLDAAALPDPDLLAQEALGWFDTQEPDDSPLIYSSLPPAELRQVQGYLGKERASEILETAMGRIAVGLVERGVQRLVVAGGETSGAVVTALNVKAGLIGAEAAPGVAWIHTGGEKPLALLLKSGNFGDPELLKRIATGR